MSKLLSLITPYYLNPGMLQLQYEHVLSLPDKIKDRLEFIVVDDCSPETPAIDVPRPRELGALAGFGLYRLKEDIRWNWIACRNLAARQAAGTWLLMTDIDHLVSEEALAFALSDEPDPNEIYRFSRVNAPDLDPYKPHPNTWLMTREMFWDRVGGYDERFSGFYGSDSEFRERCHDAIGHESILRPEPIIRYSREVQPDASTTTYLRKQPEDRAGVKAARKRITADPLGKKDPRHFLVQWERQVW
ncbi:hypothetical protein TVVG_00023 [Tetraselmis viridis virus SI1]|uniref:hypothetical protein n=1 Tax=Tetraselmis viridis virus S20 TaxID=754070 RepID=UPI0002C0C77D|nr:hypothetical protein TVGG_00044 [Tetraselmis viridis virus S20]AGH31372.1 hypothetical protein TVGG_00044 [Tetraselmis viridis virus S20]AGH31406.1 hypothetical protein TVVG_00023 [Tetraselmis viridis virus SI1]